MILSLSLMLLCAQGAFRQDAPRPEDTGLDRPGPRVTIAGVRCVHATSRVVFRSQPDNPHRYELTLAFPERGRFLLAREAGRTSERRLYFRFGEGLWTIAPLSGKSETVERDERADRILELEMRRALLLEGRLDVPALRSTAPVP